MTPPESSRFSRGPRTRNFNVARLRGRRCYPNDASTGFRHLNAARGFASPRGVSPVEHDDEMRALGLLLVVVVRRPICAICRQSRSRSAFSAVTTPGATFDLDVNVGVCGQIQGPVGISGPPPSEATITLAIIFFFFFDDASTHQLRIAHSSTSTHQLQPRRGEDSFNRATWSSLNSPRSGGSILTVAEFSPTSAAVAQVRPRRATRSSTGPGHPHRPNLPGHLWSHRSSRQMARVRRRGAVGITSLLSNRLTYAASISSHSDQRSNPSGTGSLSQPTRSLTTSASRSTLADPNTPPPPPPPPPGRPARARTHTHTHPPPAPAHPPTSPHQTPPQPPPLKRYPHTHPPQQPPLQP